LVAEDQRGHILPRKVSIAARLPLRRGLDINEAAVYVGLSPSYFRTLVEEGMMPKPRLAGIRRIWDVDELDCAFKALPREDGEGASIFAKTEDSWMDFE
jgi:excisionase family DNA binding protein